MIEAANLPQGSYIWNITLEDGDSGEGEGTSFSEGFKQVLANLDSKTHPLAASVLQVLNSQERFAVDPIAKRIMVLPDGSNYQIDFYRSYIVNSSANIPTQFTIVTDNSGREQIVVTYDGNWDFIDKDPDLALFKSLSSFLEGGYTR